MLETAERNDMKIISFEEVYSLYQPGNAGYSGGKEVGGAGSGAGDPDAAGGWRIPGINCAEWKHTLETHLRIAQEI